MKPSELSTEELVVYRHSLEQCNSPQYWIDDADKALAERGLRYDREQHSVVPFKCDFCSAVPVTKSYACQSFEAFDMTNKKGDRCIGTSDGRWAACAVCADLIDKEKWEELAVHSYETSGIDPNTPYKDMLLQMVRDMHQEFARLRLKTN